MEPTIDTKPAEDALVRLLGQIEAEHEYHHRNDPPEVRFRRYSVKELAALTEADEIIARPVLRACGSAVRVIGKHLHSQGADLDAVAERVLARAPKRFRGKWESSLAARWSGIGDWAS